MTMAKLGEQWRPKRGAGVWAVEETTSLQSRLRNIRTRRTKWVSHSRLLAMWVRVETTTPPAQPSALERVELLRAFIKAKSEGLEMADTISALESLVSEVRAEERRAMAEILDEMRETRGAVLVRGMA